MRERHHQEARGLFLRVLELKPDLPDAHYGLATVCFVQGDVLGAAHHFKEVTRHDPLRAGAFINLGALYNHLGRGDDALASLKRGIQLDPKRAEGHYNLGLAHRKLGHHDNAVAAYREAVRLQPNMGEAHFNLANMLLEDEEYGDAIAHYRAALKTRSQWPEAEQGMALAEAALGEPALAEQSAATTAATTAATATAATAPATVAPPTPETAVELPKHSEPTTLPKSPEAHRLLDPARHGPVLTEIHRAVAEADTLSKNLAGPSAQHLDYALKELANCFLRNDTPSHELNKRFEAFEAAAQNFRHLHLELERLREEMERASESLKKA
jgi:tetratricopeptide (TPR) repeat protein